MIDFIYFSAEDCAIPGYTPSLYARYTAHIGRIVEKSGQNREQSHEYCISTAKVDVYTRASKPFAHFNIYPPAAEPHKRPKGIINYKNFSAKRSFCIFAGTILLLTDPR